MLVQVDDRPIDRLLIDHDDIIHQAPDHLEGARPRPSDPYPIGDRRARRHEHGQLRVLCTAAGRPQRFQHPRGSIALDADDSGAIAVSLPQIVEDAGEQAAAARGDEDVVGRIIAESANQLHADRALTLDDVPIVEPIDERDAPRPGMRQRRCPRLVVVGSLDSHHTAQRLGGPALRQRRIVGHVDGTGDSEA